jgi:hypothetical protein
VAAGNPFAYHNARSVAVFFGCKVLAVNNLGPKYKEMDVGS